MVNVTIIAGRYIAEEEVWEEFSTNRAAMWLSEKGYTVSDLEMGNNTILGGDGYFVFVKGNR